MVALAGAPQTQGHFELEELKSSTPYSHALYLEIAFLGGSVAASYYYFIIMTIIIREEL